MLLFLPIFHCPLGKLNIQSTSALPCRSSHKTPLHNVCMIRRSHRDRLFCSSTAPKSIPKNRYPRSLPSVQRRKNSKNAPSAPMQNSRSKSAVPHLFRCNAFLTPSIKSNTAAMAAPKRAALKKSAVCSSGLVSHT